MDIAKYLNVSLIEVFKKYYNIQDELDDLEFITKYFPDILNDTIINGVYMLIRDDAVEGIYQIDKFMAILTRNYYLTNYNGQNQTVINYLMSNDFNTSFGLFLENKDFGMDLLRSYYNGLIDKSVLEDNRAIIKKDGKEKDIIDLENTYSIVGICSLTNLLRRVLCNLYNHYLKTGCSDEDALSNVWKYFTNGYDPVRELDDYGFSIKEQLYFKKIMLGLINGDLYEDMCNNPIIKCSSSDELMARMVPLLSADLGGIGVPGDTETANIMLKHFIMLQDDQLKRQNNRRKTYRDDRIKKLKKVNPFYKLDELTF